MAEEGVELLGKGRLVRSGGKKKKTYSRVRLNGVVYRCGDAVFLRAGSPGELPYIAKLKSFFKKRNEVYMNVDWFYRSSDTHLRRGPMKHPNEIFITTTGDENHIRTIIQKVPVSSFVVEGNAAAGPFFCTQRYNPAQKKFTPLPQTAGMPDAAEAAAGGAPSSKQSKKKAAPKATGKQRVASSKAKAPAKKVTPSSAASASSTTSTMSGGASSVASTTSSTEDSTASPEFGSDAPRQSTSLSITFASSAKARSKRKADELASLSSENVPESPSGSTGGTPPVTPAPAGDESEIVETVSPPTGSPSTDTKRGPSPPQPAEKRVRIAENVGSLAGAAASSSNVDSSSFSEDTAQEAEGAGSPSAGAAISSNAGSSSAEDAAPAIIPKGEDLDAALVLDLVGSSADDDDSGEDNNNNNCRDDDNSSSIDSGGEESQPVPAEPDHPGTAADRVPIPRIGARYQVTSVPPVFRLDQLSNNNLPVDPSDPLTLQAQGLARRGATPRTVLPPCRCIWEPIDERDEAALQNCEQYLSECAKLGQVKRRLYPGMSIAVKRSQRRGKRKHGRDDQDRARKNGNPVATSAQTADNTSQQCEPNHSPNSASAASASAAAAATRESESLASVDLGVCMQSYSDHFSASMVEDLEVQLKKAAPRMPPLPKLVRVQVKLDDEPSPRFVALSSLVPDQMEDFFLEKLHDTSGDASAALKLVTSRMEIKIYNATGGSVWQPWEIRRLWRLVSARGKAFWSIAKCLDRKTTRDVVSFYYQSKFNPYFGGIGRRRRSTASTASSSSATATGDEAVKSSGALQHAYMHSPGSVEARNAAWSQSSDVWAGGAAAAAGATASVTTTTTTATSSSASGSSALGAASSDVETGGAAVSSMAAEDHATPDDSNDAPALLHEVMQYAYRSGQLLKLVHVLQRYEQREANTDDTVAAVSEVLADDERLLGNFVGALLHA